MFYTKMEYCYEDKSMRVLLPGSASSPERIQIKMHDLRLSATRQMSKLILDNQES